MFGCHDIRVIEKIYEVDGPISSSVYDCISCPHSPG